MARQRGRGRGRRAAAAAAWWARFALDHPTAARRLEHAREFLPPLNFITVHYAYFIVVTLAASVVFWASSAPEFPISYVDSLFLTVSAMTEAGLNTVNLSQMTTWQQILLFVLILFGGAIWVSIWTVAFRLHAFERHFDRIVRADKERRERARRPGSALGRGGIPFFATLSFRKAVTAPAAGQSLAGIGSRVGADGAPPGDTSKARRPASLPDLEEGEPKRWPNKEEKEEEEQEEESVQPADQGTARDAVPATDAGRITFAADPQRPGAVDSRRAAVASAYASEDRPRRRNVEASSRAGEEDLVLSRDDTQPNTADGSHSFLTARTVGRNAQFHDLTAEERDELGGREYRALKLLAAVVPLYFVLWQLLGCVALGAWIAYNKPEAATSNGLNAWWTGAFFGVSAFNNSGMALLDQNVIPFQDSYFVLVVMGAMVLAGNTAYPILLRFVFWAALKVLAAAAPEHALRDFRDTVDFILRYPRRVYTNMFPARQTWWLLFMVCLLNCIDWVAFELLNLGNPVVESIPVGSRIIDGLFQAIAVRSGGFYIVAISQLYIGLQILYVVMMYISVYPVVITMRHSNVYEERSLGIYAGEAPRNDLEEQQQQQQGPEPPPDGSSKATTARDFLGRHLAWYGVGVAAPAQAQDRESRTSFVSRQIQGQLAHDMWWLVLAVLVISTLETARFLRDPVTYSVFNVAFEVVSAYGTVGISTGLPAQAYSFAGGWGAPAKLVLCLVMLRGRHRGLPVALDGAVRLPREQLRRDEEEDWRIRRSVTLGRRLSVGSRV